MGETWARCTCRRCGKEFGRWIPTPLYSKLEERDRRLAVEAKRYVCPFHSGANRSIVEHYGPVR